KMLVPEMEKKGYSKEFSTVLTAAGSLITPIIPPGIALILYGYVGNVSIGKLFMAGIVPGLTLCLIFMIYVHFYAKKNNLETEKKEKVTLRSEEHTSELQSRFDLVCRLLLAIKIIH